jgi:ubiquinone/menaquinone biosynthesis C-methylase UbiE
MGYSSGRADLSILEEAMADKISVTQFTRVDDTHDAAPFIEFLDARRGIVGEREVKELEIAMLAVGPGSVVLDVGCGTGDDAREIAGLVGPQGKVVGVDRSEAMVDESRKRASGSGLPVEFVLGDAYHLQFADQSFDRARADRVFVHLEDPAAALAEMARVLRPGGRIVVSDPDVDTIYVDSPYRDTTRRVFHSCADRAGSGLVGRALPRMFEQAGLCNVACTPQVLRANLTFLHRLIDGHLADSDVAGLFSPGELEAWWQDAARAEAAGHFHCGFSVFTVVGQKR